MISVDRRKTKTERPLDGLSERQLALIGGRSAPPNLPTETKARTFLIRVGVWRPWLTIESSDPSSREATTKAQDACGGSAGYPKTRQRVLEPPASILKLVYRAAVFLVTRISLGAGRFSLDAAGASVSISKSASGNAARSSSYEASKPLARGHLSGLRQFGLSWISLAAVRLFRIESYHSEAFHASRDWFAVVRGR